MRILRCFTNSRNPFRSVWFLILLFIISWSSFSITYFIYTVPGSGENKDLNIFKSTTQITSKYSSCFFLVCFQPIHTFIDWILWDIQLSILSKMLALKLSIALWGILWVTIIFFQVVLSMCYKVESSTNCVFFINILLCTACRLILAI